MAVPFMQAPRTPALWPQQYFFEAFDDEGTLDEAPMADESASRAWWLNSGAQMIFEEGRGRTLRGTLPIVSRWRRDYAASDAEDTQGGMRPQNVFRLLTRPRWQNVNQQLTFRIDAYDTLASPHRNESNGVLLMSRYQDGNNLYYAGIRVDGALVIKKKIEGRYYELARRRVFEGPYDRTARPNVIPLGEWFTIGSRTHTTSSGIVHIEVWFAIPGTSPTAVTVLEAIDDGSCCGAPFVRGGHTGIRTDFMEIAFDAYSAAALPSLQ